MSGEIIAILAVGVALAGLLLTSSRGLRQDMRQDITRMESRLDERIGALESRLDERVSALESRLRDDMKQLGDRMGRVEHSQAKLEGLLEGLRESITGRAAAG